MSTKPLPVVPYDPARHGDALFRFITKVMGAEACARRRRLIEGMHAAMPGRDRFPLRHVLLDGDRVAGALGYMPADFWVEGKRVPARFTHDLLVDPDYRGGGLGKVIVGHARERGDFFPGGMWMTDPCCKIHVDCGFDEATPLVTHSLVLSPAEFLARRGTAPLPAFVAGAALRANRAVALHRARRLAARAPLGEAPRFDAALDGAWEQLAAGYGVTRVRDAAYLNWKYADHPTLGYRSLLLQRGDRPAGFMIWRAAPAHAAEKRAIVADFLVAKGDTAALRELAARVIVDATAAGMDSLSILTTQPWAAGALRGMGFLPRAERNTWVVAGWRGVIPAEWLRDTSAWHVCLGDSDGDMWTGTIG